MDGHSAGVMCLEAVSARVMGVSNKKSVLQHTSKEICIVITRVETETSARPHIRSANSNLNLRDLFRCLCLDHITCFVRTTQYIYKEDSQCVLTSYLVFTPDGVSLSTSKMEWSNEMVLTFLDYYGEEPVIWNASHPSHKQRNEVHDAWKRIEEKMGGEVSVVQLKKKKDSLMASFRIVAKRAKSSTKSGAGAADVYKPIWFAYEKMARFLSDKDESRTTLNSEVSKQISHTYF